jgi:glycosyltransferase involved in cell wall biosynthesis
MRFATSLHPRHIPRGDAVIATAWWTTEFVDRYPASKGARFSLLQHYEDWSGPRDRVDATWRLPIRKLVVSRWLLDKGVDLGVPEADLRVVPNGLSLEDYPVLQPVESRPKRVAMLVSGERWKGTAEGIRALELARMRHPDLTASCFGVDEPPDGLPAWASYVRRPSLEVLVRDVYNGSAIYLCPSWSEGWGLPSTEAMASGCALVSTNVVGDYAIDGETALLAPPRDPEALAAHLVTLLDDPERRTALARRGREAIGGCTWERSTAALIRSLVDGVDGSWQPGPGRAEGHVPR